MIVDASVVIDAVADPGARGAAARAALSAVPATEPLLAPGHFAVEVMAGMRAAASRSNHPLAVSELPEALDDTEALGVVVEATPWSDVRRGWELAQGSLSVAAAVYVAAAERHHMALLTADTRIERSGASINCQIITVTPGQ